jgi:glucose/arabinose dehydrogenase
MIKLSPHAAALGMKFIDGQILIAEHGSWNRKIPIGYRIMSVKVDRGVASDYQVFLDGWLGADGKTKGRPVDILVMPDQSILISDDFKGAIYRLSKN